MHFGRKLMNWTYKSWSYDFYFAKDAFKDRGCDGKISNCESANFSVFERSPGTPSVSVKRGDEALKKNTFGLLFPTWMGLIALRCVRHRARLPPHHFLLSLSRFSCLTGWIYQRQRTAASKTDLRLISSRIRVIKGHVFGSTRPSAVFSLL